MPLQSHSDGKSLALHLEEVLTAALVLLGLHPRLRERFEVLVRSEIKLHDTGKATVAFQEYIKDPSTYKGDPKRKAHTPLGLLATAQLANLEQHDNT